MSLNCKISFSLIEKIHLIKRLLQNSAGIPPNMLLLEERDRDLLFVLIFFHRCVTASGLLWDQSVPFLPLTEAATSRHQALPQGWFPRFWHYHSSSEHSKPVLTTTPARELDTAELNAPDMPAKTGTRRKE